MRYLNRNVIMVGTFSAATALLVLYLLSIRWHIYLPVTLFWVAVALMLGTITYQSLGIKLSPSYAQVVLLQIAAACFAFHMIYQIPYYGLRGADAYVDMASVKGILSSGFVMGDPRHINSTSYFPMIHVFGAMVSLVTSIGLFSVVKWFPSLLDIALIPLLYLLVRRISGEEKIALLSVLLFACLQHHVLFGSLFVRQTYALVLAVCCLYLYFSARHSPYPTTNYALSIVSLMGTVLAHHLTSFVLLIFLLVHFMIGKGSEVPFLRRAFFGSYITEEKVGVTFLLIASVAIFAYWMYVVMSPIYTLVTFVENLFGVGQWGGWTYADEAGISAATIRTIRGYIIFYGFYSFHLVFGIILLYGLLFGVKSRRLELYSFTLLLFLCGLIGGLSLYFVATGVFPDRFLMFGWLFGFAPLVVAILKGKSRSLQRAGVFLLFAFMLFNVYMIDPSAWDARAEKGLTIVSEDDYALANTFDLSSAQLFGPQSIVMAIYDVHNNFGTTIEERVDLTEFNYVAIEKKMFELELPRTETMAGLERLATEFSVDYSRIYESDNILVFKRRQ